MGFPDELDRVKLRFISAYEKLLNRGDITEEEFDDILHVLDHMDDYSEEELQARLGRFRNLSSA